MCPPQAARALRLVFRSKKNGWSTFKTLSMDHRAMALTEEHRLTAAGPLLNCTCGSSLGLSLAPSATIVEDILSLTSQWRHGVVVVHLYTPKASPILLCCIRQINRSVVNTRPNKFMYIYTGVLRDEPSHVFGSIFTDCGSMW